MIETITIITLTLLLMSILRPGKTPPLDNPLVIERPGRYHMTLAPQINLAQPFIEAVAGEMGAPDTAQDSSTQFFEVCDKQVKAHGHDCYLLAVTQRNGMLYFQASGPKSGIEDSRTIAEFAASVLERFPASGVHDSALDERLAAAVQQTAQRRGIGTKPLAASSGN